MTRRLALVLLALCLWPLAARAGDPLAAIVPGRTTKAELTALLGAPWRVVQFDDCGDEMPGQADETWEYRGKDSAGPYRLHVEFDDDGTVRLVAKVPDGGSKSATAKVAPAPSMKGMTM
ncbi:MAG TPA: hypothetical protein VHW66_20040 [Stellaceae bacterium]|jgi:hypothetical protein|nr:hypothetical protein [Stellaceae bacterium]